MTATVSTSADAWYRNVEKTSETDDNRIKDITMLPPPEHLIRFFPIHGTEVETLITRTRKSIQRIMAREDDRQRGSSSPSTMSSSRIRLR